MILKLGFQDQSLDSGKKCLLNVAIKIMFLFIFLDVPERPEEVEITKVTRDLISMTWKPPKSDGGSEITMYILEARMIGKDKFTRLTKDDLMDRKYTMDGLKEGDTYEFRVMAVNEVGAGKPSFCTKSVTCRDELGECCCSLKHLVLKCCGLVCMISTG